MTTVRTSISTHDTLKYLSKLTGLSLQGVLDQAVKNYKRIIFLEKLNADFAASSTEIIKENQDELRDWDQTLNDGLEKA